MGRDAWMDAVKNYRSDVVLDKLENAYEGMK